MSGLCLNAAYHAAPVDASLGAAALPCFAPLDPAPRGTGVYRPTPTIIRAARSLYARHTVHDISRSDAGAANVVTTGDSIHWIITEAKARGQKAIVFVIGVSGAGKTLVGLNLATRHGREHTTASTAFLSSNRPLVAVLREALVLDEFKRRRHINPRARNGVSRTVAKVFIRNVSAFREYALRNDTPRNAAATVNQAPVFHDNQQLRNGRQLASFMNRMKSLPRYSQTESVALLFAIGHRADWTVAVCLGADAKEINAGEAGLSSWLESMSTVFTEWNTSISPNLTGSDYASAVAIREFSGSRGGVARATLAPAVHLSISMGFFRAAKVSRIVTVALDDDVEAGRKLLDSLRARCQIVFTRSMKAARRSIRRQRRATEWPRLAAFSSAKRLKFRTIAIRKKVDRVHRFLSPTKDTRPSFHLGAAATELQATGLVLDWTIVIVDADIRGPGTPSKVDEYLCAVFYSSPMCTGRTRQSLSSRIFWGRHRLTVNHPPSRLRAVKHPLYAQLRT